MTGPLTLDLPIVRASPAEAAAYAHAAARAFHEAYHTGENDADLDIHLAREFGEEQQWSELEDSANTVLAARESSGEWAGFVALRTGVRADGVSAARPIEIKRFYLRQRWYGRGLAHPLMDAALAYARAAGHDGVWLQVWEHNRRARRFYERCGFVAVGMSVFMFGDTAENDPVYQLLFNG